MPRTMQEILDHADELARRLEDYEPDPSGRIMPEWHTWDAVRDELGDSLGNPVEQTQRVEQLRRELALLRLVELRKRSRP